MEIAERALDLEAFAANGIAMGAPGDECHTMPRRCHSPAEISSDRPRCHNRNSHLTTLRLHSETVDMGCARVIFTSSQPGLSRPVSFRAHFFGRGPYTHQIACQSIWEGLV
jgi:hypothetical protein